MAIITASGGVISAGASWVGGVAPVSLDNAIVPNGVTITMDQDWTVGSMEIQLGGHLDYAGYELTCDDENGAGLAFDVDGTITRYSDLKVTTPATTNVDLRSAGGDLGGNIKNFELDSGNICEFTGSSTSLKIEGNVSITSGIFRPSGNSYLTIIGDLIIPAGATFGHSTWDGVLIVGGNIINNGVILRDPTSVFGDNNFIIGGQIITPGTLTGDVLDYYTNHRTFYIDPVNIDRTRADRQDSVLVSAIVEGTPDFVYCKVNDLIFQMEATGSKWWTRIPTYQIGVGVYTVTVYAVINATREITSLAYDTDLTIAAIDPMLPSTFIQSLLVSNQSYQWKGKSATIIPIYDEARIDKANTQAILLTEGKIIRKNMKPREHYTELIIPMTIECTHYDSYKECRKMFELDVLDVLVYNKNLEGFDQYDFIEIMDSGQNRSVGGFSYYQISHIIRIHKYVLKDNIEGF